jgi:uracil phosphoribosyltransferase
MCFFSILRAGEGLLSGMSELVPSARIGHVGLYRDPKTLEAVEYYFKAPADLANRLCIVVDPMLATGHSASAALTRIKQAGAVNIRFICLLSAPDGIATLKEDHPDVPIYTGALDRECNEKGYILPGLGDAGDRLFGTRSGAIKE